MIVAKTIEQCRRARAGLGNMAFVPTMGALHAGHVSLITAARIKAPRVAVSIFVNPTQFAPTEDFHRYPRPIEDDLSKCHAAGVDLVFCPSVEEMYPTGTPTATVDVPSLTSILEGESRPGHFAGVCQVVAKLFQIVSPQAACFGEKDFQQLAVVTAMTRALNFPVTIVPCPTLREPDGLAMSSRNRYLSPIERHRALTISKALFKTADSVRAGETSLAVLAETLRKHVLSPGFLPDVPIELHYATIVDRATLQDVPESIVDLKSGVQAVVAMRVGKTRLIDNVQLSTV